MLFRPRRHRSIYGNCLARRTGQGTADTACTGICERNLCVVGMCAAFVIDDKQDGNPHAHIMLTMRPLEQSGEWGAKSKKEYLLDKDGQRIKLKNGTFKSRKVDTVDWNSQEKAEVWRQAWADIANRYLAAQDRPERIDHRSYKRQGIEQIPPSTWALPPPRWSAEGL